jgi:hypothetical protein
MRWSSTREVEMKKGAIRMADRGYRVRLVNHGNALLKGVFKTIDDAVAEASRHGFEVAIDSEDGRVVAHWDAISGVRYWAEEIRLAAEDAAREGRRSDERSLREFHKRALADLEGGAR